MSCQTFIGSGTLMVFVLMISCNPLISPLNMTSAYVITYNIIKAPQRRWYNNIKLFMKFLWHITVRTNILTDPAQENWQKIFVNNHESRYHLAL